MIPRRCGGVGQQQAVETEQRAGISDGIAAGLRPVAKYGPEFAQAAVNRAGRRFYLHIAGQKAEIGEFCACAEIGRAAKDGIAEIGEMTCLESLRKMECLTSVAWPITQRRPVRQ